MHDDAFCPLENVPAEQLTHALAVCEEEYCPCWHGRQPLEPVPLVYQPGPHVEHAVDSNSMENSPTPHSTHADEPAPDAYCPGMQAEQAHTCGIQTRRVSIIHDQAIPLQHIVMFPSVENRQASTYPRIVVRDRDVIERKLRHVQALLAQVQRDLNALHIHDYELKTDRRLAVAMGGDRRLGMNSLLCALPNELLHAIIEEAIAI